jgi:hypothetical protein
MILIKIFFSVYLSAFAKTKIAVIDTGYNAINGIVRVCDEGHRDFTKPLFQSNLYLMSDLNGHGQNVSHLIERQIQSPSFYCQIIVKYTNGIDSIKENSAYFFLKSLEYVANRKDIALVNISGGGIARTNDPKTKEAVTKYLKLEKAFIQKLLDANVTVVVAAGNDNLNLDKECVYYPACHDPRIYVVGNGTSLKNRYAGSNYGKVVDIWIDGRDHTAGGHTMTGSSQSTAIFTGKLLNGLQRRLNVGQ